LSGDISIKYLFAIKFQELKKHFDVGQNMQNITMHDRTLFNAKGIYTEIVFQDFFKIKYL